MDTKVRHSGFSLVEVLIAISILLIATVGPMTIAARSAQSAQYAREQNTAFFLAQEGIEAVMALRADRGIAHINNPSGVLSTGWLTLSGMNNCQPPNVNGCSFDFDDSNLLPALSCPPGGCRVYFNAANNRTPYSHDSSDTATQFTRQIFIQNLGGGQVRVQSVVNWQPTILGATKTVRLETYLYDIYNIN
jgi:prepilin-type N-terminal cleavage/methylation domain-containing protein